MKKTDKAKTAESRRTADTGKKVTSKQVVAVIGVALLVLMYIGALIAAFADKSASGHLFWACLYATVIIPILIWIYTWMYGKLTQKHTFADFDVNKESDINKENEETRKTPDGD